MDNFTKEILFQPSAEDSKFAQFKQLYPNCFNKNGEFIADKFNELIQSQNIPTAQESYSLQWLGKSYAKALEKMPSETLLAEDTTHNAKPENAASQNLLIKGNNLEVLKHLKHAYAEKVKMIYIDPPYNTGSDGFVYQDDRKFTAEQLVALGNMDIEAAQKVLDFTAKKSNSHSAWLTFMYPRLYIARELLREDGVIFISIDDNEVAQLKILCDEVFGEGNFVANILRKGNSSKQDSTHIATTHEYVLMYAKNTNVLATGKNTKELDGFNKFDENGREYKTQLLRKWGENSKRSDRPNLFYPIEAPDGSDLYPMLSTTDEGCWRWGKSTMQEAIDNNQVEFIRKETGEWIAYEKIYKDEASDSKLFSTWLDDIKNNTGTKLVKSLFDNKKLFNYPKPVDLIERLTKISSQNSDDLILDFFAGSGTTAHAVMKLNAEDNGNRKFILVQLPEKTDKKSEAYKAGFETIFDITQARLEKSAVKIREEFPEFDGDLGFKIFETVPDFRMPLADAAQGEMYPVRQFSDGQIHTLLTTWRLHDGQALTDTVQSVSLDGYTAYLCGETLYLLYGGLDSAQIKALIERLDDTENHRDFAPKRIVLHGDLIESSKQKELAQAVQTYANKKDIRISLIARV